MNSLTDLYNEAIVPMDVELEKQATEMVKQAEEEDAAGRIMARGFADELNKIAGNEPPSPTRTATPLAVPGGGGTVKSAPYQTMGQSKAGPSTGQLLKNTLPKAPRAAKAIPPKPLSNNFIAQK